MYMILVRSVSIKTLNNGVKKLKPSVILQKEPIMKLVTRQRFQNMLEPRKKEKLMTDLMLLSTKSGKLI